MAGRRNAAPPSENLRRGSGCRRRSPRVVLRHGRGTHVGNGNYRLGKSVQRIDSRLHTSNVCADLRINNRLTRNLTLDSANLCVKSFVDIRDFGIGINVAFEQTDLAVLGGNLLLKTNLVTIYKMILMAYTIVRASVEETNAIKSAGKNAKCRTRDAEAKTGSGYALRCGVSVLVSNFFSPFRFLFFCKLRWVGTTLELQSHSPTRIAFFSWKKNKKHNLI
jgi:hypothetical protein